MILFFALCCIGVAVAGLSAWLIFWPLTLVHLRDRYPDLAEHFGRNAFFHPAALGWLLWRRYRRLHDLALCGLATPAWLALLTCCGALVLAALLALLSKFTA